jgi:arsenate reductase
MKADGIDISGHSSNHIDEYQDVDFDYVITVCDHAKESCPVFPSTAQQFHRDFPDPAKAKGSEEQIMASFETTRNMIREYCKDFVSRTKQ